MNLSYWELTSWFSNVNYTIVGSGIVGLSCALRLRKKYPEAKILVLERGKLPQGASTKNAGFACFGSVSELIDDLKTHSEDEVVALVKQRIDGLQLLRQTLGDAIINYQELGGYELFLDSDEDLREHCFESIDYLNQLLNPLFGKDVYRVAPNQFNFKGIHKKLICNVFEGQIDTGKMMQALLQKVQSKGVLVLNDCEVKAYQSVNKGVSVSLESIDFVTDNLLIATNGFAKQFDIHQVKPARAQVLITKPIKNLRVNGTFHLDKGFYYFRNIQNRVLFGGGRNLNFKGEETTVMEQTQQIQDELERILKNVILPNTSFEIDHRWSGIMGVGDQKKPIVQELETNVYCAVRLGGMGIAIGSSVGHQLADMIED